MRQLHFGEFSAEMDDSHCYALFRGREPIGLSDVPRNVLFVLLEHRPRPVTGKTLLNALWRGSANPSNVAKQVRALRLALGDDQSRTYIKTLKKEGYAFVMPVTEANAASIPARTDAPLRRVELASAASVVAEGGAGAPVSETEWRMAQAKLTNDLDGSCLHDLELLEEAIEECDSRIQLLASHRRLRLHSRFPQEPALVPRPTAASTRWTARSEPDRQEASRAAELVEYSRTAPIMVNVGSYSPACISVLCSLRRRYGLDVRGDSEGLSGRQQILRLIHDDDADFLLAPHAPFLLVGDHRSLDYRWVTPVHEYAQSVLRVPGTARGRKRKLLVYKGGSPEEQLIVRVGIPTSAEPEMVGSLEKLIARVPELAPGDMVIAWEPLASGLESKHQLKRTAEFRCWVSLYCHKRWQRGAQRTLKNQFTQLFVSEWIHCRKNREWAVECLALELRALEFFAASSGLGRGQ
jgi:DNA-binding winged helix-turn-helix (wHTH) protein